MSFSMVVVQLLNLDNTILSCVSTYGGFPRGNPSYHPFIDGCSIK